MAHGLRMISKTEEETSVKRLKKDNRNKRNVGDDGRRAKYQERVNVGG